MTRLTHVQEVMNGGVAIDDDYSSMTSGVAILYGDDEIQYVIDKLTAILKDRDQNKSLTE